jgi:hypothetical protein
MLRNALYRQKQNDRMNVLNDSDYILNAIGIRLLENIA